MRTTVGWIGILFPLVLAPGNRFLDDEEPLPHSISRYYYTGMHDVAVGELCAMVHFPLLPRWIQRVGKLDGVFALGVAFFPTSERGTPAGLIHYLAAGLLFLTLSDYSMILFRRQHLRSDRHTRLRVMIHRGCALIMVGSVISTLLHEVGADCDKATRIFTLVVKTFALEVFGISRPVERRSLSSRHQGV